MKFNLDNIKIFYFIFLIIGILLFCLSFIEVNAAPIGLDFVPTKVTVDGVDTPTRLVNRNQMYWYETYNEPRSLYNRVKFSYDFSKYMNYKYVSFMIHTESIPVVTLDNITCSVSISEGGLTGGGDYYDGYIGVVCPNEISNPNFNFYFGHTNLDRDSTYFYISSQFTFYDTGDLQTAVGDIQKGVDEVNDSIKEQADQQHKDAQETQDKIQSVDDTLNDGSVDSDAINSIGSNLPGTNGVLSSILSMPVKFFSTLLNSLNTTSCPSLTFPIPFVDQQGSIPCFRSILSDMGALTWYEGIGGLVGGLLIFTYIIHLGKTFHKMGDLDDTGEESWGGL